MTNFTTSQEFFIEHVTQWREFQGSLRRQWAAFRQIDPLPPVSDRLSPKLKSLEPKLNEAILDIRHNVWLAQMASERFGDALVETGRQYGLTDDQAADLANEILDD